MDGTLLNLGFGSSYKAKKAAYAAFFVSNK
jgi:hypothetical protein